MEHCRIVRIPSFQRHIPAWCTTNRFVSANDQLLIYFSTFRLCLVQDVSISYTDFVQFFNRFEYSTFFQRRSRHQEVLRPVTRSPTSLSCFRKSQTGGLSLSKKAAQYCSLLSIASVHNKNIREFGAGRVRFRPGDGHVRSGNTECRAS